MSEAHVLRDRAWQWLLDHAVIEVGGRLVHRDHPSREVVLTPEQWLELVEHDGTISEPSMWSYLDDLSETAASGFADEKYVVLADGQFRHSVRRELPPLRGGAAEMRRAEEFRRLHDEAIARDPDARVGWYVVRPDGSKDWFRDAPED